MIGAVALSRQRQMPTISLPSTQENLSLPPPEPTTWHVFTMMASMLTWVAVLTQTVAAARGDTGRAHSLLA